MRVYVVIHLPTEGGALVCHLDFGLAEISHELLKATRPLNLFSIFAFFLEKFGIAAVQKVDEELVAFELFTAE